MTGWSESGADPGPDGRPHTVAEFEIYPAKSSPLPALGPDGRAVENQPSEVLPGFAKEIPYYSHVKLMANGHLVIVGPSAGVETTDAPRDQAAGWTPLDALPAAHPLYPNNGRGHRERLAGNAIPLPGGTGGPSEIMMVGGYPEVDLVRENASSPEVLATNVVARLTTTTGWIHDSTQAIGRSQTNTVILPDGSLVTVGGSAGVRLGGSLGVFGDTGLRWSGNSIAQRDARKHVELYNPTTTTWTTGPAQQHVRSYHSVAMLLPDGRVLSGGDEFHENVDGTADPFWIGNVELYSPPYLFQGARPTIARAALSLAYGGNLQVETPDAATVDSAVLMTPSATTHGNDMTQRHVTLAIVTRADGTLTLRAPANGAVMPPGYQMLFLLRNGIPSVAKFVRLGQPGPAEPSQIVDQYPAVSAVVPTATPAGVVQPKLPLPATSVLIGSGRVGSASVRTVRISRATLLCGQLRVRIGVPHPATLLVSVRVARRYVSPPVRVQLSRTGFQFVSLPVPPRFRAWLRRHPRVSLVTVIASAPDEPTLRIATPGARLRA